MGRGWRRAFCTTISREQRDNNGISDVKQTSPCPSPSPRCVKLGFFSNPTTPRLNSKSQAVSSPTLRCTTNASANPNSVHQTSGDETTPSLYCRIKSSTPKTSKTPKHSLTSNPSSPRSPLKLSLFKNSFKFRSSCGICLNSVKTGQGTAIYTAECSHAFHFPCIATHVRKKGNLICPVCNATWKDVPLLSIHQNLHTEQSPNEAVSPADATRIEEKRVLVESSPRGVHKIELPTTPKLDSRSYEDDEPLLSPRAGGRFVSIPEAEEKEEEFQGFFVNPTQTSEIQSSRNVEVKVVPEAAIIARGRGYETYAVALRVKAPAAANATTTRSGICNSNTVPLLDSKHRAPIDLVTVLDVSGSMTGAKLQMLKRAMRLVIASLGSADRLSIVAFSANANRLLPLRRMISHNQRSAMRIVDGLVCGQGTCVDEALRKATKVLEDRRERNPVASIMLLSDGQDERVRSNCSSHRTGSSTRFAHIEIPVHSFGFGQNGGYTHEPAEDAFAKCVGGLLSVVVQDLRVQLGFQSGSAPAEILAVYTCNSRPTVLCSGSIRLGDLYAEQEMELLVEVRVPCSSLGSHHVMSVRCLYKDPASHEVVYCRDQALRLPLPQSVGLSTPNIRRLRNVFIITRAIAEARRIADHNDFVSAYHLLASSRALVVQHSSASSAEEYVRVIDAEMAELHWRKQQQAEVQHQHRHQMMSQRRRGNESYIDDNGEPLTPTSAWRAAEKLAKVAMIKKSLERVRDLHGFENARF